MADYLVRKFAEFGSLLLLARSFRAASASSGVMRAGFEFGEHASSAAHCSQSAGSSSAADLLE